MEEKEFANRWIMNNAIIAFVAMLLVLRSWQVSEGTINILNLIHVSGCLAFWFYLNIGLLLFAAAIFFFLANFIPRAGSWAVENATLFSHSFDGLFAITFFVTLPFDILNLPIPSWLSILLLACTFVLTLAIVGRMARILFWVRKIMTWIRQFARPND